MLKKFFGFVFKVIIVISVICFVLMSVPSTDASTDAIPGAEYGGFDVVVYYYYLFQNYFADYTWQVKASYGIIIGACIVMMCLFFLFGKDVFKHHKEEHEEQQLEEKYLDAFRIILGNDSLTNDEMIEILGTNEEELRKNKPEFYVKMLAKTRMEMYELIYLPNLQKLADLIGVREYMELNLLRGKDVFHTLQVLLLFQLIISEGRLANYINSSDLDIRMLARMCYILCSDNDPYRYLQEDLDAPQSLMRPMLLHYIFGWMKEKQRRMPNFLIMSERIKNEDMAAFMVREIAYWGGQDEKEGVHEYFMSPNLACRSAAINVVAMTTDRSAEEKLMKTYEYQPEHIRRDILNAILAIGSNKRLAFLVNAFETASARPTRELALSCIYNYGNEGRRKFEEIRANANEVDKILIDQIDTQNVLTMIRSYN